ncbi:MAG: Hsp70 family protein [Polyangiaceae bacterium]
MKFAPRTYAIDFGTSNSLLAAVSPEQIRSDVPIDPSAADPTIFRSVMYLVDRHECHFGERAMTEYIARGSEGRLLRSLKRFLPAIDFNVTYVGAQAFTLEDLIGGLLRQLRERANRFFDTDVSRVMLGRPARFSDDAAADRLAQDRLERAARLAGFDDIAFCPEPVAAAHDFARDEQREQLVLVGDFGGGTSDFSVVRLSQRTFSDADVLAIGGVSLAGDALDSALMRAKAARHFGAELRYKVPFGSNVLSMPKPLLARLSSPAEITLMRRSDVIDFVKNLRAWSLSAEDKGYMENLLTLIEDGLGFQLFESIERAKRELSSAEEARIVFDYPSLDIDEPVRKDELEAAIADAVRAIFASLDDTLRRAGISAEQIDVVCLTGGTGRVPVIAEGLTRIFRHARIHRLRSLHAVVQGLAERARSLSQG